MMHFIRKNCIRKHKHNPLIRWSTVICIRDPDYWIASKKSFHFAVLPGYFIEVHPLVVWSNRSETCRLIALEDILAAKNIMLCWFSMLHLYLAHASFRTVEVLRQFSNMAIRESFQPRRSSLLLFDSPCKALLRNGASVDRSICHVADSRCEARAHLYSEYCFVCFVGV